MGTTTFRRQLLTVELLEPPRYTKYSFFSFSSFFEKEGVVLVREMSESCGVSGGVGEAGGDAIDEDGPDMKMLFSAFLGVNAERTR